MFKKLNDPKAAPAGKPSEDKPGKSVVDLQSPPQVLNMLRQANQFTEANGVNSQPGEVESEIVLYGKGLMIDKTVYREYVSPEGQKALEDILQGRVPQDLLMKTKAQPASLIICDRRTEEFVPEKLKPTQGGIIGKIDLSLEFKCDESLPCTTLQIRFHNDQDMKKIKVNMRTKVSDLHDYIIQCAPVNEEYVLMCGHPPTPLEDPNLTVEDMHLLNGTVIQQILI